jgi:peptidoglycan/LPS O-acetylase OafA/YrhL
VQGAPQQRDALLDILRAWAITHVILFHVIHGLMRFAPAEDLPRLIADYPWWMNFSWQPLGVDIIFLVSAFLLTRALLSEIGTTGSIDLRRFYVRRVSRIIPLYYIAVLLFALAQGNSTSDIILSLFFVEFLFTGSAIVPVGWSMELMMYVYLALPLVAYGIMRSKRPFVWLACVIIASIAIRFGPLWGQPKIATTLFTHLLDRGDIYPEATALYFAPWFRLTPFLIGITLAALVHLRQDWLVCLNDSAAKRLVLRMTALVLIGFSLFLPVHDATSWIYQATAPAFWTVYWATNASLAALGAALLMIAQFGRPLSPAGPWAAISRNIMGIYLFHMPMILIGAIVVFRSDDPTILGTATVWHILGIFLIALLLSLGVAALLNRFVERPTQSFLRRKFNA